MKSALSLLLAALLCAGYVFAADPQPPFFGRRSTGGCTANCTLTGTTVLADAGIADLNVSDIATVKTVDAGVIVLGTGTSGVPQIRAAGSDLFVTAPVGNDVIFQSADGTERGRFQNGGQVQAQKFHCLNTDHCGTKTLSTGSGTVTVASGVLCICTDSTAAAAVKCSVSSTTLTITGTSSDVINYFCF